MRHSSPRASSPRPTTSAAAKESGADAVPPDLDDPIRSQSLLAEAEHLRLDTLVEAHDAAELERGVEVGAPVLGVNARGSDLKAK